MPQVRVEIDGEVKTGPSENLGALLKAFPNAKVLGPALPPRANWPGVAGAIVGGTLGAGTAPISGPIGPVLGAAAGAALGGGRRKGISADLRSPQGTPTAYAVRRRV